MMIQVGPPRPTTATGAIVCHTNLSLLSFSQEERPTGTLGALVPEMYKEMTMSGIKGGLWLKLGRTTQIPLEE